MVDHHDHTHFIGQTRHGAAAADAAEAAAQQFRAHVGEQPERLLRHCHDSLRTTRGVVATVAWFDLDNGRLTWTGIGNVEGRLVRSGSCARRSRPATAS